MATIPQPSGKPLTPPPAYSEYADPNQSASASAQSPTSTPFSFPTHASYYGPTPIAQQVQLLPYYDPRSPYAVAEATRRARWRFIEAALWAIVVLSVVSLVTGWEVEAVMAHGDRTEPGAFRR